MRIFKNKFKHLENAIVCLQIKRGARHRVGLGNLDVKTPLELRSYPCLSSSPDSPASNYTFNNFNRALTSIPVIMLSSFILAALTAATAIAYTPPGFEPSSSQNLTVAFGSTLAVNGRDIVKSGV